jgi:hypothetical protein
MTSRVRHAAQRARGRRRSDEGRAALRQARHARLVAEDRTAAARGGRIDRQHRHLVALCDQIDAQLVDGRGLAHARHAGDANAVRPAGVGQQSLQELMGAPRMLVIAALDQRNGATQHRPIAGQHAVGILFDAEPAPPVDSHRQSVSLWAQDGENRRLQQAWAMRMAPRELSRRFNCATIAAGYPSATTRANPGRKA